MTPEPADPTVPVVRCHIAQNVRRLRKAKGLSQEKLGELAECHRTYVSQLERCVTNISVDRLEKFAQILDVEFVVLISEPEADPRGADSSK
ncbi:helix-turn-helix transcriptional regulator [Luteimonas sp. YGD11-2]|uniref:helix-turn-helix domain-containing protein n=1 Tax=Luteimonas sp. YGD11-2 TaxID=2508168 RepID=UPI00100C26DF|nr:helix-turn-helix transcriptional regulator [Luteimonas sp. YGD11-2]